VRAVVIDNFSKYNHGDMILGPEPVMIVSTDQGADMDSSDFMSLKTKRSTPPSPGRREQVCICRRCDRGQIYCPGECRRIRRRESLRREARGDRS